jgi:hypothetical protein
MSVPLRHSDAAALVNPLKAFELRCWARAYLWDVCKFDLHEAVDVLQSDAERDGLANAIGQDGVQAIMRDAFHRFRSG